MNETLKKIGLYGIVPVIKLDNHLQAVPLGRALCRAGLPVAEITLRTGNAVEGIKRMKKEFPNMIVGAGTVISTVQVDTVLSVGADFIVSPGLNPKVVKHCVDLGVPITPGCSNPSDIEAAIELGLDTVKFFPAEAAGGLPMIKAMSAPYGNMKFMPTGGLNEKNILDYLKFKKVIACGGSYMVPSELISAGEWDKITDLTKAAVKQMLGFEVMHIGINCENQEIAGNALNLLETMFGFESKKGTGSSFVGDGIELLHAPNHEGMYLGKNGHIAIGTNFIDRAVFYFENMGIKFKEDTKVYDDKGNLKTVYFENEIAGFAFHLIQK